MNQENIYPVETLPRAARESLLGQRAVMIWFTGLSGSGKSTLALALERRLHAEGRLCRVLDGDNIRTGINNNLGFSLDDRYENIRRIAEVGRLFVDTGVITIAAFISPTRRMRELARGIIGEGDFFEIYVNTPLEVCEGRDVKGLYKKARAGLIKEFTGVNSDFEVPASPALTIDTSKVSLDEGVDIITKAIGAHIAVR
ncbi:MAG: adenylyl-sulfate kinase [Rikenellaceae bacterium]|nr:adenylyl-sulfate kinase [Rikenellaceae bacterium]